MLPNFSICCGPHLDRCFSTAQNHVPLNLVSASFLEPHRYMLILGPSILPPYKPNFSPTSQSVRSLPDQYRGLPELNAFGTPVIASANLEIWSRNSITNHAHNHNWEFSKSGIGRGLWTKLEQRTDSKVQWYLIAPWRSGCCHTGVVESSNWLKTKAKCPASLLQLEQRLKQWHMRGRRTVHGHCTISLTAMALAIFGFLPTSDTVGCAQLYLNLTL